MKFKHWMLLALLVALAMIALGVGIKYGLADGLIIGGVGAVALAQISLGIWVDSPHD